jgi:hypothetical protein
VVLGFNWNESVNRRRKSTKARPYPPEGNFGR